jgi:UDP-N-acetylglucosamine acyltransferase
MNTGTEEGGGVTRVGERCFFMVGSHVGHDCAVGSDVTLANNVVLGGHVSIGDHTFLGGHVAIHQFVRIGEGVMMAGMSAARDDIIPFGFAHGQTGALVGLNMVGLRRRGATRAQMHQLRRAYRSLFLVEGRLVERIEAVAREFAGDPLVEKIIAFIRAGGRRPLMRPRAKHSADERGGDAG